MVAAKKSPVKKSTAAKKATTAPKADDSKWGLQALAQLKKSMTNNDALIAMASELLDALERLAKENDALRKKVAGFEKKQGAAKKAGKKVTVSKKATKKVKKAPTASKKKVAKK